MKITKLTDEQQKTFDNYIQKYLSDATKPTDKELVIKHIKDLYKDMEQEEPIVIFGESPRQCILLYYILRSQLGSKLNSKLRSQLYDQLHSQLRDQLQSQLDSQLYNQLEGQVYGQLLSKLGSQLCGQLENHIEDQLDSHLENELGSQLENQLHSHLDNLLNDELYSQLSDQLDRQLRNRLRHQLENQIEGQLYIGLEGPLHNQLDNHLENQLHSQLRNQIHSQLHHQIRDQIHSKLGEQLSIKLDSQLYDQLENKLHSQLRNQIHSQLHHQIRNQLDNQISSQLYSGLESPLHNQIYSQTESQLKESYYVPIWWRYWSCYYNFAQKELNCEFDNYKLDQFSAIVENCDCIFPFENFVFISEKCTEWHLKNARLHNENEAAIKYADGYSIYALNGIVVPEWLVNTPSHELTLEQYKNIESADIRIEFVAKYGIERMKSLGAVIDSFVNYPDDIWYQKSQYELIDMCEVFEGDEEAVFLGMKHATTGMYVMEVVGSGPTTIKEAFQFREQDFSEIGINTDCQIDWLV
jgi:uncharacterized membrane protein YheB (UPF0754 family)